MTGEEFSSYIDFLRAEFGWKAVDVRERLGCGVNQITRWRETGCPRYIGLALVAIALGLQPGFRPDWTEVGDGEAVEA
ncbi:hypothetical protein [Methylosinus sp. PW1]|uniref:hypothetical protein n=1 Tax=Methylosinus sp. PW1 TaxID=107636 RepID=UPI00056C445E|nr:hypothetical protein [Methylosinus sp. PW1]